MKKSLKIAFLMDPLEDLDLKGDTTFALALEAQRRAHKIFFFKPSDLILKSVMTTPIIKFIIYANKLIKNYKKVNILKIRPQNNKRV